MQRDLDIGDTAVMGYETALALSRSGRGVVIACRSPEQGQQAAQQIQSQGGPTSPSCGSTLRRWVPPAFRS